MSHPHDFEPLHTLLSRWMAQHKQPPGAEDFLPQNLPLVWAQMVGPLLARASFPVKLSGHTLSVEVSSEAWEKALAEQKPLLLGQLKMKLPRLSVRDIQFSVRRLQ